jgi:hypothetical protein
VRETPENFRNGFPEGGTLIKPSAGENEFVSVKR